MLKLLFLGCSAVIAILAALISQWSPPSAPRITTYHQGRNNSVLFLGNSEFGLSNVLVATAATLLEYHPDVEVHFASFPSMGGRLERISNVVGQKKKKKTESSSSRSSSIVFHELSDLSFLAVSMQSGVTLTTVTHPPGIASAGMISRRVSYLVSPWSGEDHITLFEEITGIIDEVDPALVILDVFFRPAIDATRNRSRLHAFIAPLTPIEHFPLQQPHGSWLWKYPVMGSGIPYPVPWSRLVENIYLNIRYFYAMIRMPHYTATKQYLTSKGLADPVNWFNLHSADVPWFTQALPGASYPLEVIPPNVTFTGPITLSLSPASEQSPELTQWLSRGPTVLINLGSLFLWSEQAASAMAHAVADTLAARSDLQILWKFQKAPVAVDDDGTTTTTYDDDVFAEPLRPFLETGRVRMEKWLDVEPTSLLETGHIAASVHHGGSGCYHEALGSGVPQIALPQWLDHYSFAQLAQDIGVGVWACRDTSPNWTPECLRGAFSKVLLGGDGAGASMRENVERFARLAKRDPGQRVAAREVARLAASGRGS